MTPLGVYCLRLLFLKFFPFQNVSKNCRNTWRLHNEINDSSVRIFFWNLIYSEIQLKQSRSKIWKQCAWIIHSLAIVVDVLELKNPVPACLWYHLKGVFWRLRTYIYTLTKITSVPNCYHLTTYVFYYLL